MSGPKVDDGTRDLFGWDGYQEVRKFVVVRPDGLNPDARYFVLDLTYDPLARLAARVYALGCKSMRRKLCDDLMRYCTEQDKEHLGILCPRCQLRQVHATDPQGVCYYCGPKM